MDIVRRAYLYSIKELPETASVVELKCAVERKMVRWIKLRVYAKSDWPSEIGPYPKEKEADVD